MLPVFFFPLISASAIPPARADSAALRRPVQTAAGKPTQGPFSLLAVTHTPQVFGFLTPPRGVIVPSAGMAEPVMASAKATGLWIGVQGGVGYKTITPPADGLRHTYSFGSATLVVDETRTPGYSIGWTAAGTAPLPEWQRPYETRFALTAASPGHPAAPTLTLIPSQALLHFRVMARPLSACGEPLGRPVTLICQVVNRTTVFAQIPNGYSAATQQFQVTVTPRGRQGRGTSWRIADLPTSVRNGKDDLPPVVTVQSGPVTIRAAAAEAEDFSGYPDFWNRHPERNAGGGWTFSQPLNADGHAWSGVPSIRFMLSAHNASRDSWGQNWVVKIVRVTPQWNGSPVTRSSPTVMPLEVFPVYNPQSLPPDSTWVTHDWQVGVAYPGQQHWVKIEGEMIRSAYRTETVTFHDAEIVRDAAFGGDRVVWRKSETQTTRSGVSVTVLNARAGASDASGLTFGSPNLRFDYGNAELLLAWHLPPGIASEEHAPPDAEAEATPPCATGSLKSEWDNSHPPPDWKALVLPGDGDTGALWQAGDTPLRLSVMSTALPPPDPSRLPPGQTLIRLFSAPLPHHLDTVSFRVTLRERQESHPFTLLVPVRPSFPPGWNPAVADGRSASLIPAARF